ncbi:hypothetical protein AOLI_G00033260 [Acnodon oligacanthus]
MEHERPVIITTRRRCYKVTRVCLGLMYVLLLPAITAMHVTLDRDQSQASDNKMVKEVQLEQLKSSYEKLKIERDQLQASYNELIIKRDQLQTSYRNLVTERDQLQDKVKEITEEKDKLEAHYILTKILLDMQRKEKEALQSLTDSGHFRVGDRVRVKASVSTPKYKWGSASHSSIGVVTEVGDENMMVDFPEHKSWKAAISEMELAPRTDSALDGESLKIEFPEHKSWKGLVSEMELAPSADSRYFRIGDRVRVKASVHTPKYEWGHASHKSVGVVKAINGERMTVDFPEHESWNGLVSEMELAPSADLGHFRVGDRVRVKASVSTPKHGWGDVSHTSVGVVRALDGEKMTVDFPGHKSWAAAASEMELAPKTEIFRVGDRVRVKASVSTPKYKWGDASHKSVGVVTEIDGESLTVDFPDHKTWKGIVSEMELAPSSYSEFCKFKPGDKVRVKASVETPKYQWGSASHKSVGTIKALKMEVDFPEQSNWAGDPSEMELAP